MSRVGRLGLCLFVVSGVLATPAHAVEFTIVGPRAAGMGGAGVAVTSDAMATYWNPAGLAMSNSWDLQLAGSAQFVDRLGLTGALQDLDDADFNDTSPENVAKIQALTDRLNQPGASSSAMGAAGLYFKGTFGHHAFGFNISDVATGGGYVPSPVTVSVGGGSVTVNGQLAVRALEARQAVFSYAYGLVDGRFAIGASAKIIQGAAYSNTVAVRSASSGLELSDDLGKATLSTAFGLDLGAMAKPVDWLRIGIVAKDINQPTFDAPGGEYKLSPQVRGGVAVNPYKSLTVTFDADLTSNKALIPNVKSRMLSLGAEQTLFDDVLALRVGAYKNVEDAASIVTSTAGFGIKLFALRVDVSGGYDFREGGAIASGALSLTF